MAIMNKFIQGYYNFAICDGNPHILIFQTILNIFTLTEIY